MRENVYVPRAHHTVPTFMTEVVIIDLLAIARFELDVEHEHRVVAEIDCPEEKDAQSHFFSTDHRSCRGDAMKLQCIS
jgi:hypothetical protein